MANEIQFGYRSGATLTYGAYQPDGTVRTAAATSLPEIGTTGYYTATDASIAAGDAIIVIESPNVVGYGVYQPEATVSNISEVQNGVATETKQDLMQTDIDTIAVDVAGLDGDAMRGTDNAATEAKQDIIDTNVDTLVTNIGTPADIDSGGATIADNLKKFADDNGGADFDATTDSLEKIRTAVDAGTASGGTPSLK